MECEGRREKSSGVEGVLGVLALAAMAVAWGVGSFRAAKDLTPFLEKTWPGSGVIERRGGDVYTVWQGEKKERLLGYLASGSGHGYGGELKIAAAVSPAGYIMAITVVDHKETASFFRRVLKREFLPSLVGKSYDHAFELGRDVDGISGATYTCRALAEAVRQAGRKVAGEVPGFSVPPEPRPKIQIGLPEITLALLLLWAFLATRPWFKYKKTARWLSLLLSLIVLGFMYNKPLTLVFVNKMLLGFFPPWQTHLYWYLLTVGSLFFIVVEGKNLYCDRVCPFGAGQECLGLIGGAKLKVPKWLHTPLRWLPRLLALAIIVAALTAFNPGVFNYEVYGALFHLVGSDFLFILLAVTLLASLFFKRPWCRYLCPVRAVLDFFHLLRTRARDLLPTSSPNSH